MAHTQTETQPRKRPKMSAEQRAKLFVAQRAYVAHDPRWPALRRKGRTFSYIAEEIGVWRDVIGRELRTRGIDTSPVKPDRRARRGQGFWRCFDA